MSVDRALRRLAEYARATGVRFANVPRHAGWDALGLPDVRGFTPHLRTVNRFAGERAEFPRQSEVTAGAIGFDDLTTAELWLLHDLAHVIWYDFARLAFGERRFAERDFFLEHHLASEAFAVLLLDYHLLSRSRHHGLAVELDAQRWDELSARLPLPPLDSPEMTRELLAHYLAGESALFRGEPAGSGADATTLAAWREHEKSYADKQRWYVWSWWDDLASQPLTNQQAVVEDRALAPLVDASLRLFTAEAETPFQAHLERTAARLAKLENAFAGLPKYRRAPGAWDFRFTDATALEPLDVAALLKRASAPRAETLFLLWQLLTLSPPDRFSQGERNAIAFLARSVQTLEPDAGAWNVVRSLCERTLIEERWKPDPRRRAAFFLP